LYSSRYLSPDQRFFNNPLRKMPKPYGGCGED
jgi:hypothetical protein